METSEVQKSQQVGAGLMSVLLTALLLCLTDVAISTGGTQGRFSDRLPEHFSAYHLKRYLERVGGNSKALLVLGDSVLWGYSLPADDTAIANLRHRFPHIPIINAAYEAGSPINYDFVARYLLANGILPRAVLFDLNPLSFNQFSKSYNTLNPALESLALPTLLTRFDAGRLSPDQSAKDRSTFWTKVDDFLEIHWALYGSRVDIHQALFGDADAATSFHTRLDALLPAAKLNRDAAFGKTPAYAEMYDLSPLNAQNISYAYTQHFLQTLAVNRIPAIAILTPTNHALLHSYIDVSAYDDNLRRLEHLCRLYGVKVLNLDRGFPQGQFIDNTHLTKSGNDAIANKVAPAIAQVLNVL